MFRTSCAKIFSVPDWSDTSTKTYDLSTVSGREQVPINIDEVKGVCFIYVRENNEYYRLISDVTNGTTRTLVFNGSKKITITVNGTVMTVEFSGIDTESIQDNSVTSAKLATNSVSSDKIQNGAITASKIGDGLINYVTPEMFGAEGNGVTDDTLAVQQALNTNSNLLLPNTYLITDTLIINKTGKNKRVIFGNGENRWSLSQNLVFMLNDTTKPCIELQSDGLTFNNITARCETDYATTFIKTNRSAVDIDLSIIGCRLSNFICIVDVTGRGVDISNNVISGCQQLLNINWSAESDTVYHDDLTGQRAFNIFNNRLHSMSNRSKALINVESGNVFGLRFVSNNIDRGTSPLIYAEQGVFNWLITDNTFIGVNGLTNLNDAFMYFNGTVEQVTISTNNFTYVQETGISLANIILIKGFCKGLIFSNNNFNVFNNIIVILFMNNIEDCILTNNNLEGNNNASTTRGMFTFTLPVALETTIQIKNTTICNNVIGFITSNSETTRNQYIINCTTIATLFDNVKMIGNIKPSTSIASDIRIASGTPDYTNCIFDWNLSQNVGE